MTSGNIGIRVFQGFVGAVAFLFTLIWGGLKFLSYDTPGAFIDAMVPIPLALPLVVGLLTVLNIEVLAQLQTEDGDIVTEPERRAARTIARQTRKVTNWNSRWDQERDQ